MSLYDLQSRHAPRPGAGDTGPDSAPLILRDGSTALLRRAVPEDAAALQAFLENLSPLARRHRLFSEALPPPALAQSLCQAPAAAAQVTLLATRYVEGHPRIVAVGTSSAKDEATAEVSLAVDEAFHGQGLGTLLLERLALLAVQEGYTRLWAVTHADNRPMRDVFRDSGFALRESYDGCDIEVELALSPMEAAAARSDLRERLACVASLRPFFHPRAVALVGASRDAGSIGGRLFRAIRDAGFQGPVYPINPRAAEIGGLKAYPSLRQAPEPVDLAIIAVPPQAVPAVVEDCAARGVRALVMITAGFAETGPEGRDRQRALIEQVRAHGMRMVGPNCLGLVNTDPAVRLNASFSPVYPPAGRVAMSSQSGALGLAVLAAAGRLHLGLSTFVSVGNKADVSSNDLLQYWEDDPKTDVILLYQESFGNPRRFARIARRVARRKPVVAVKGGRTGAGRRAAGSHTAALAASDVAVDALFRQTGVIRAETLEEMFALAGALGSQPLPQGRRVAILTNAGGPAILCADMCEARGLLAPALSDPLRKALAAFLPPTAGLSNPVDLIAGAGPEQYRRALQLLYQSDETDAVILIYVSVDRTLDDAIARAVTQAIAAARSEGGRRKPVLVCWMSEGPSVSALGESGLPCYSFPELPALVLGKMADYAGWRQTPPGRVPDFDDMDLTAARSLCGKAAAGQGTGWLSAEDCRSLLTCARLPLQPGGVAKTETEAAALARSLGFPVAAKVASRELVHKTEIGGVKLNLTDEWSVRRAFKDIRKRLAQDGRLEAMDGLLVQPMVAGGVEVMAGMTLDPLFGPIMAFGLGGIHVEILRDVCFRVTPLTDRDAGEMIRGIKGFRLLEGYRGHPAADLPVLEELLLRLARLVEEVPEIAEVDLNPVFALPPGQGCRIVDVRIKVERPGPS